MDNLDGNEFDTPYTDNLISQTQPAPPTIEGEQAGLALPELQNKLRNSAVYHFYKYIGYPGTPKYYGNFEYDDSKLYFITDRQRISLSNEQEEGKCLALSTLQGRTM